MGKVLWVGVGSLGNKVINKVNESHGDSFRYVHIDSWKTGSPRLNKEDNSKEIGLFDPDISGYGAMPIQDWIELNRRRAEMKKKEIGMAIVDQLISPSSGCSSTIDSIKGCIFGQAIGDALGLGTEFMSINEVERNYPHGLYHYDQIIQDRHRCRWQKGSWTDDTDMMLCIADAIVEDNGKIDYLHIARNFKAWYNGTPMGIGSHTNKVLCLKDYVENPLEAAEIIWKSSRCKSASNGALMRTSILGVIGDPITDSEIVCKLTHADPRCVGSCVIVSSIIHSLVYNDLLLNPEEIIEIGERYSHDIKPFIKKAVQCGLQELDLSSDVDMGFTLKTLSAAIWAVYHAESFEDGLLSIVNAGGDADTNAAVACSILGAKFGISCIPPKYVSGLIDKDKLEALCASIITIKNE